MAALDLRCNFIHWFQAFVLSVFCKPERGAITVSWSGVICAVFFPNGSGPWSDTSSSASGGRCH